MKIFGFFLTFVFLLGAFPAYAEEVKLCAALEEEGSYEGSKALRYLVPGKEGWVFISGKDFFDNYSISPDTLSLYQQFQKALKAKGTDLVLAIVPTRGMMHGEMLPEENEKVGAFDADKAFRKYTLLLSQLGAAGLTPAGLHEKHTGMAFGYKRDHHWNKEGARLMAQAVANEVKALPVYKKLRKEKFESEVTGQEKFQGSFSNFVKKACGAPLPPVSIDIVQTASTEISLFGRKDSEVILLGTSYSTPEASKANFEGYLKEYLEADVLNMALGGGGVATSILSYMNSDKGYQAQKPKVIIWEVPGFYSLDRKNLMRELIPSVHGGCKGDEIAKTQMDIKEESFTLFEKIAGVEKGAYLRLEFSTSPKGKVRIMTKYKEGKKDSFPVKRSKRYVPDGVFFMQFENRGAFKNIKLKLPEGTIGTLKAVICKAS